MRQISCFLHILLVLGKLHTIIWGFDASLAGCVDRCLGRFHCKLNSIVFNILSTSLQIVLRLVEWDAVEISKRLQRLRWQTSRGLTLNNVVFLIHHQIGTKYLFRYALETCHLIYLSRRIVMKLSWSLMLFIRTSIYIRTSRVFNIWFLRLIVPLRVVIPLRCHLPMVEPLRGGRRLRSFHHIGSLTRYFRNPFLVLLNFILLQSPQQMLSLV